MGEYLTQVLILEGLKGVQCELCVTLDGFKPNPVTYEQGNFRSSFGGVSAAWMDDGDGAL